MNCPACNGENVEKGLCLIKGKAVEVIANCCGRCGMDLRPYHDEIMKHTNLKPLPLR